MEGYDVNRNYLNKQYLASVSVVPEAVEEVGEMSDQRYLPRGTARRNEREWYNHFERWRKKIQKLLYDLKSSICGLFSNRSSYAELGNNFQFRSERFLVDLWGKKGVRYTIYSLLLVFLSLIVFRIWWNINFENLEVRDLQDGLIQNAFGSNSHHFLQYREYSFELLANSNFEFTQLLNESSFKNGYFPVFIFDEGVKNITFNKITLDFNAEKEKRAQEGCFCAAELGLSLDATFLWTSKQESLFSTLEMYTPKVTFLSNVFYTATYELGSFVCANKIQVDFFTKNGMETTQVFEDFFAVCISSCYDFVSKMTNTTKRKLIN